MGIAENTVGLCKGEVTLLKWGVTVTLLRVFPREGEIYASGLAHKLYHTRSCLSRIVDNCLLNFRPRVTFIRAEISDGL